eukprot:TRINITY_DN41220_c0_g1_i1.p2 TRINITY_DN41220_c0_g1~~TRINITY_DN41220_c0_g1_i1.p2  ORF type:complete len:100 (+),score=23.52 TRINITY_DN41220_c0_g1_i1:16-315(+)
MGNQKKIIVDQKEQLLSFEYFIRNDSNHLNIAVNVITGLEYFKTLQIHRYPVIEKMAKLIAKRNLEKENLIKIESNQLSVSYTHLTLPTKRIVLIAVDA